MIKGIPVSSGIFIGKVYLYDSEHDMSVEKYNIDGRDVEMELQRLKDALSMTRLELSQIRSRVAREVGDDHANIFTIHILLLDDPLLMMEVNQKIKNEKTNAEYALWEVVQAAVSNIGAIENDYLKERAADVYDVGRRVLRNLIGIEKKSLENLQGNEWVIVAKDLSPSDTAQLNREKVKGFVTDIGGRTSHTAIMAKALEIPAIVGLKDITKRVKTGDTIIVDGHTGIVIINPEQKVVEEYENARAKFEIVSRRLRDLKDLPAQTTDGARIELSANIEIPEEVDSALSHGAEGIGLYRTEFLFINRIDLPGEDEQYEAYSLVLKRMGQRPVIIRTLDLGGDKFLSQVSISKELNPFLGCRAIRFCLERPDIFKTQLRALLRASVNGNLRLMFPMISGLKELRSAKNILDEARSELKEEGKSFAENIPVGVMVEIPAAAVIADFLIKESDFFSIGTNDLIQYSLAVDRVNEKIAYLYEPLHPAVLRLIKTAVDAAHREGKWVGMCGEMAGDPYCAAILVGLGLDEMSMSAVNIPEMKKTIRSVSLMEAKEIVEHIWTLSTAKEIEDFIIFKLWDRFADVNEIM